jgi:hypothetical protein
MQEVLRELRKKYVTGVVGGSNLEKISEQLSVNGGNGMSYPSYVSAVDPMTIGVPL